MSFSDLQLLENLLLQKNETIGKLIKGTDQYYYYNFLKIFNEEGLKLSEEQQKQLIEYSEFKTSPSQNIKLRALFLEYDSFNTETPSQAVEKQQQEIINKINIEFLNITYDIKAPDRVGGSLNSGGLIQQIVYQSEIDQSIFGIEQYLNNGYQEKGFIKLKQSLFSHLNMKLLAESHVNVIKLFMSMVGNEISDFPDIPFLYDKLASLKEFKNEFPAEYFQKISLKQMEELLELNEKFQENENFVEEFYLKQFQYQSKDIQWTKLTELEQSKFYSKQKEVYEWTKTLPSKFKSFNDLILYQLLQIGYEINFYDFDLFLIFLKKYQEFFQAVSEIEVQNLRNNGQEYSSQWNQSSQLNKSRWISTNQLIDRYLEKYFEKSDDFEIFEQFLETKHIKTISARVKLYLGQQLTNIYEYLSSDQIEQMNSRRLITICPFNQLYFKHGDPVKLNVELKNIPKLNIKIFEFNSENYYLYKEEQLDSSVNLDGLIALEETDFLYNIPPIQKVIKEFEFETITKTEKGIFIIEFIGNGISSRAIIKKGRLQLRETITSAGHRFQISDENFELCDSEKTGIWLDKKFYKVDQQRKEVLIPFAKQDQQFNVIIVHGKFAELTQVLIKQEQYTLKCAFLICEEQLLMGSQATAVIIPKLYLNGCAIGLQLLKDQQVQVTSISDAGVPTTLPFDNMKFDDSKPVEIQFPITSKLQTIQIKVSGKVIRMHRNDEEKEEFLQQIHTIQFDNLEGQSLFCNQYLKFDQKNGYQIFVVGKNGEPKRGLSVTITFRHQLIEDNISQLLSTDAEGKVTLGPLTDIFHISSTVQAVGDVSATQKNWEIKHSSKISYPQKLTVLEGELISLPYNGEVIKPSHLALNKIFGSHVLESKVHLIEFKKNMITFTLKEEGTYELLFIRDRVTVSITVVEGVKWKNSNIIKSKNQLIVEKSLEQQISFLNISKEQIENGTKISGTIATNQKAQIFAFATTFVFENFDSQLQQIEQLLNQNLQEYLEIDLYSSIFQSNKELSDEQKYVLNRKTQERYIGNTLEKPQFLLQRQYLRETNIQGEQLNQGGSYQNTQEQNSRQYGLSKSQLERCCGQMTQEVSTFQDFLQYPATLYTNIELQDNKFEFNVPYHYSTVTMLIFNSTSLQYNIVSLKNEKIETRNISHSSRLERDKFYSVDRNSVNVQKGVPIQVQDLTSMEIKLIDSIDKLFLIMKELRKANGGESQYSKSFVKWEFLIKWHQQTTEQKHKLYDDNQCDELNLFIYFKDPAYFETYTEAYINNKIEKSFIDCFLLHDLDALQDYASMQRIQELNALEQALLVIHYAEIVKQPEEAKWLAQYIENQNKQKTIDERKFKIYFDTVLGAKIDAENVQYEGMELEMCSQQNPFDGSHQVQQKFLPSRMQISNKSSSISCDFKKLSSRPAIGFGGSSTFGRGGLGMEKQQNIFCDDDDEEDSGEKGYYNDKRQQFIESFKNIEKTKEYCEKHYSRGTTKHEFKNLVPLNGFFADLANHSIANGILQKEFLSSKFIHCCNNETEMIAVLALIGLPNEAPPQEYKQFGGKGIEIKTQSSALLFMKEIKEGKAQLRQDILIAQRFFDPKDRFVVQENDPKLQLEKDGQECIIDKIYGCQVIITNCSSTQADYQVLVELPNGAIPVNSIFYTKSQTINFQPYTTQRIEYYFYFPKVGKYNVYPANVSRFGQVVSVAQESTLTVVEQKSVSNLEAIDDILAKGSKDDILNFLKSKNIFNRTIFRAEEIRYLLKDKEFYLQVVEIYRKKRFFDLDSLKFSLYHNDRRSMKELFSHSEIKSQLATRFKYFKCSLFEVSNIRMLEYYPLITKRVHKLTSEAKGVLNIEFRNQYIDYLTYLVEKQSHSLSDKLGFIYYLLLQERINEAIQVYKTITDVAQEEKAILQYDYFTAYLDFHIGYPNFAKARKICEKYLNYPIIHWRNLFYDVLNLLAEYDGDEDENQKLKVEQTNKNKQTEQAKKEETLATIIEGDDLTIAYSNLSTATIYFYKIDLETLFSRNPFLNKTDEDFSFVLPNLVMTQQLETVQQQGLTYNKTIQIPDELKKYNLFIQIKGESKRCSNRYYSTSLSVQVIENFGQIRVSDSEGRYLSKVYVKAYIKGRDGKESFYKDGYTDLRGRFDYASMSSANLGETSKFSLLIASDEFGSIIKESTSLVGRFESEVKLVSKAWNSRATQENEKQINMYEKNRIGKPMYK